MRENRWTTMWATLTILWLLAAATPVCAQPAVDDLLPPAPVEEVTPKAITSAWQARPVHIGLQASFAALQAMDATTTLVAVHRFGARETNPAMSGLVNHPVAFVAAKSAMTALVIKALGRLSATHPKVAMLLGAGLNAGLGAVVAHNYGQIAGARR